MTFMRTAGMLAEHAASKPQRRMLAKGLIGAVMMVPTSLRKTVSLFQTAHRRPERK
jgi:hypothetical protein